MRQAAQCVGRVIRSKTDYGIVILADKRFSRPDKRAKLPPWITSFVRPSGLDLSTDFAIEQMKVFLKVMGQPVDAENLGSILLTEAQVGELQRERRRLLAEAEAEAAGKEAGDGGDGAGGSAFERMEELELEPTPELKGNNEPSTSATPMEED